MLRTQISLEGRQHEMLKQEAGRLGISMSALLRRIIDAHLASAQDGAAVSSPLGAITGIADGRGEYVARKHNRYLYGEISTPAAPDAGGGNQSTTPASDSDHVNQNRKAK